MRTIIRVAALAAALAAPGGVWSQPADSLRTPGSSVGSSQGVAGGWQYVPRRQRTVAASGAAAAGLLLIAVAAANSRR